jgi:hypothetical protein
MLVDNSLLVEMFPGVRRSMLKESPFVMLAVDGYNLMEKANASVTRSGNFTIAVIDFGGTSYTGVAKRNPLDQQNTKRGDHIALSRALKSLLADNIYNPSF